jgi:hypothetical protein
MSQASASAGSAAPVMDDEGNEIPRALLLAALKLIKSGLPTEGAMDAGSTDEGREAMGSSRADASKRQAMGSSSRGRMVHEGSKASEPAVPEPTMVQVQLPPGIKSMTQWGDTRLAFGKFQGKGYYDIISSTEAEEVSYVQWCLGRRITPSSPDPPWDFAEFIAAYKQLNEAGTAGSVSLWRCVVCKSK